MGIGEVFDLTKSCSKGEKNDLSEFSKLYQPESLNSQVAFPVILRPT